MRPPRVSEYFLDEDFENIFCEMTEIHERVEDGGNWNDTYNR